MKAVEIMDAASRLVGNDRERSHGDKLQNHQAIAAVWNGYLLARVVSNRPLELSAVDVANMMELLKVARRLNGGLNIDDFIDGVGYAACAGEIASRMDVASAHPLPMAA